MKFLGVLLSTFAVSCVHANPEECTEERGDVCIDNLLRALRLGYRKEDVCREFISSVDCLKEAVDDCLGERNSAVDDVIEALDKLLGRCRAFHEEMTEIEKCYEQNEHYIMECVYAETEQDTSTLLLEEDDEDDDKKCERYVMMYHCYVNRIREKCGDKAGDKAEKEVSDVSHMVSKACRQSVLRSQFL